jgi:hypothetical protein
MFGDTFLSVSHYRDCLADKEGWIVAHGTDGGMHWDTSVFITDPDLPGYADLDYPEWPRSLWGYFPTKQDALDAIENANLSHKLR